MNPYIKQPITLCFSKSESEFNKRNYTVNVIQHFDHIFGVHDDQTALFSLRGSKDQQRQMKAAVDMNRGSYVQRTFCLLKGGR